MIGKIHCDEGAMSDGHDILHSCDRRENPFIGVVIGYNSPRGRWVDGNGSWYDCSSDWSCENDLARLRVKLNFDWRIDLLEELMDV